MKKFKTVRVVEGFRDRVPPNPDSNKDAPPPTTHSVEVLSGGWWIGAARDKRRLSIKINGVESQVKLESSKDGRIFSFVCYGDKEDYTRWAVTTADKEIVRKWMVNYLAYLAEVPPSILEGVITIPNDVWEAVQP